jgi:hypothetical protein
LPSWGLFGIAALLGLTSCRKAPSPTVFLDPALAVLVPRDTTILAGVRMQHIRATPFYQQHVVSAPRLAKFRQNVGLPNEADVWEYLIAADGEDPIILMRGKFSEMGMEPRSAKEGAERISHRGVSVIGDDKGAIAFLNPTTAMAGTVRAIKRALDERNENTGVPTALKRLASEIPSNNEAWIVSVGPAPGFLPVRQITAARAAIDPLACRFDFAAEANSVADAAAIADALNGKTEGRRVVASDPIPSIVLDWLVGRP